MYKILKLNKISQKGIDRFRKDRYEVLDDGDADAIILRSMNLHDFKFGKNLKAIARAGAGVNNIPIDRCTKEGIVVFNTPGANANAVKEIVLASMLLSARDIVGGIFWSNSIKDKKDEVPSLVEKNKSNFAGFEIKGKTLGVIGLGAIGALVANDAISLGMKVIGYDPYLSVDGAWRLSNEVQKVESIEDIFKNSDFITIHVPLLDSTKEMINKDSITLMRDGVSIINFSRGELVNNNDIIDAIKSNKINRYVTDFPKEELLQVDGVLAIPHLGASTKESEENCAIMATEELIDYLENGNIQNSVNFPNCNLGKIKDIRLSILNKNIPNIIGNITSILAKNSINIEDMVNKSRGDLAYTLIDTKQDISDEILKQIEDLEGVIRVRVLKA